MKRKIVRQGTATMMVSLPSKWIKKNNLNKGDEINILEKGNDLVITPEESKENKKEAVIDIQYLTESSIRTLIINAYRLGHDKIKISFKHKDTQKIIDKIIKSHLIGFEIIKKGESYCEIENITEPAKEQFDNILSKIFLNIDELFEITEKYLTGNKVEFHETEEKIMQYGNFCRRILSKKSEENYALEWAFHSELIHGQREIYHMLKYLEKNKIKPDKDVLILLNESRLLFDILKKSYNEKNIPDSEKIHTIEKELVYIKGYDILKRSKNPILIHHILNSIRNFYLATSPLIGILI